MMSGRTHLLTPGTVPKRRVQFAKTPRASTTSVCSTSPSCTPRTISRSSPRTNTSLFSDLEENDDLLFGSSPACGWRRASAAIICGLENKKKKVQTWKKISNRIEKRRQKELEDQIANFREAHLPALDKNAVKRSTCRIVERKRIKSAPADKMEQPCQPDDVRQRPSTELKNRLQDYQLPISYNNFIVNQLEMRFSGLGYDALRTS